MRGIGERAFLIALLYGLRATMGVRGFEDFYGRYIKLGNMIWERLPAWNHPILLVLYAAFALLLLFG